MAENSQTIELPKTVFQSQFRKVWQETC